jgi:hypothetical protein
VGSVIAAFVSLAAVYPAVRGFGAAGIMLAAVVAQIGNLAYMVVTWARMPKTSAKVFEGQAE